MRKLIDKWKGEAALFRKRGLNDIADLIESMASELWDAFWDDEHELMCLQDAAKESGYSYSTLQRKVASGEIPNYGGKGSPLIARKHLPRKVAA